MLTIMQNREQQASAPAWALFGLLASPWQALPSNLHQHCIKWREKKGEWHFSGHLSKVEKKKSSSSCSKSGRVEINLVRKVPLKHPSQTPTDHSGIYISLVYFLPPQKQSCTLALFQHSTAPCTGQIWRTAVEEEGAFMMCSGDGASTGTCME